MRVALAQINTTVGDIDGNVRKILETIGRAQALGAGYTLFPELTITGYPPEDLLHKDHFVEANLDALELVSSACATPTLVGYVDRVGDNLYNAMAMCGNGMVLQRYHKRRLPNYGVFDEERYFAAGEAPGLTELGGTMMANTICEDIWVPELAAEAAEMGAQVLFNISASPFHAGQGRRARGDALRASTGQRRVARVLQPRGRAGRTRLRRSQRHHLAGWRSDRARQGVRGRPGHRRLRARGASRRVGRSRARGHGRAGGLLGDQAGAARLRGEERLQRRGARPVRAESTPH